MKTLFPLNYDGSVTNYLVTRPVIEDFVAPYTLKDQLAFEKEMRELFYKEPTGEPPTPALGAVSPHGTLWEYNAKNRNPYVDFSTFYFTLKRVGFYAATVLVADKPREVRARIWSYAAFDMWHSGVRIVTEKVPVYHPIRYTDVTLKLKQGDNDILFLIQNFGVRDTRNMLKLQLLDTDGVSVTLPIEDTILAELKAAEEWLLSLRAEDKRLVADGKPPVSVSVNCGEKSFDFGDSSECEIPDNFTTNVSFSLHNQKFSRIIDRPEHRKLNYKTESGTTNLTEYARELLDKVDYGKIDAVKLYTETLGHAGMNYVIANVILNGGSLSEYDERIIDCALDYVRERRDCSDFELAGLLRLVLSFNIPERVTEKIKEVALIFRYWMDEDGADAMCFWSENHALMFYVCGMLAGRIWKDETFLRSKRTGAEQERIGRRRIAEWFDVILAEGFEEFLAGGYMGVTVAALLTVYDFADSELRDKAKAVLDRIARESAIQCFKGIHVAPMGRIYRGVISPYISSVQGILYLLSEKNAKYVCARAVNYLFSDYKFPDGLDELMTGEADTVFNSGRAEIHTRKTEDNILTSVASPRATPTVEIADETTEYFKTKVMNEGFHGTTLFIPGGEGYQQHLWYAAISERFLTFVNLPGSERDFSGMRPGYWFGNLIFPTVKQKGRELYCHYDIPDSIPTGFTHAYFPETLADEVVKKDSFRFARVGDSYLALFSSLPLTEYREDSITTAELRAYGREVIWYVKVGSRREDGSFDSFIEEVLKTVNTESCKKALD